VARELEPHVNLRVDHATGIASVADGHTGLGHSCHPNISATGSVAGMRKLGYWGKNDRVVRAFGFYYNTALCVVSDKWDRVACQNCRCGGNHRC